MSRYNKNLGDFGEAAAAEYLINHGYDIVERNFRTRFGEIDIIARLGQKLIFTEVKTRSSEMYGLPSEAVDRRKQKHMRLAAEEYFRENNCECEVEFDVLEVSAAIADGVPTLFGINHIQDVLIDGG